MRITTQMLAHSAAKSGIPFQQTTLLDILNKKSSEEHWYHTGKRRQSFH